MPFKSGSGYCFGLLLLQIWPFSFRQRWFIYQYFSASVVEVSTIASLLLVMFSREEYIASSFWLFLAVSLAPLLRSNIKRSQDLDMSMLSLGLRFRSSLSRPSNVFFLKQLFIFIRFSWFFYNQICLCSLIVCLECFKVDLRVIFMNFRSGLLKLFWFLF